MGVCRIREAYSPEMQKHLQTYRPFIYVGRGQVKRSLKLVFAVDLIGRKLVPKDTERDTEKIERERERELTQNH